MGARRTFWVMRGSYDPPMDTSTDAVATAVQATPSLPDFTGGPLAAVDMGSNSFRLEIGQLPHGRYKRIDYLKETVRLGAGLDREGMLTEEAQQRGIFGAPTFFVGDEMFWGNDRLDDALDLAAAR